MTPARSPWMLPVVSRNRQHPHTVAVRQTLAAMFSLLSEGAWFVVPAAVARSSRYDPAGEGGENSARGAQGTARAGSRPPVSLSFGGGAGRAVTEGKLQISGQGWPVGA